MTYEQNPKPSDPSDECLPLDDLVEQLASDAARGEFDKSAKSTLEAIAKNADKARQDYARDTDFREHLIRWEKEKEKVVELGKRLTNCFPNWRKILIEHVCEPVIKPIRDCRQLLYYDPSKKCPPSEKPPSCAYGPKVGFCETTLAEKDHCLKEAKAQLDAWKDITGWIKKRLDDNQALYDEICKLDKCEDYAIALYIYFFELLPAHRALDPAFNSEEPPESFEDQCCHGRLLPDCGLIGYPWLIDPDDYRDKLDEVACAWLKAGREQAEAEAAYDQIEVLKKKLEDDDTPASRRAKATEELKNLKYGGNKGHGGDPYSSPKPDGGGYHDPNPDPDPGSYPKPDPDPYAGPDSNPQETS